MCTIGPAGGGSSGKLAIVAAVSNRLCKSALQSPNGMIRCRNAAEFLLTSDLHHDCRLLSRVSFRLFFFFLVLLRIYCDRPSLNVFLWVQTTTDRLFTKGKQIAVKIEAIRQVFAFRVTTVVGKRRGQGEEKAVMTSAKGETFERFGMRRSDDGRATSDDERGWTSLSETRQPKEATNSCQRPLGATAAAVRVSRTAVLRRIPP